MDQYLAGIVIASVHLADVGAQRALGILRRTRRMRNTPGLRYAALTTAIALTERVLPRPSPARVGLIAAWDDDAALDDFLADGPLAEQLHGGWHVRLAATHIFGAWRPLDGLLSEVAPMDDDETAAVLTIGRLRLSQTPRFLRASAGAEGLAKRDPAMLAGTALARPPGLVATFSLWRSTREMRAYAGGAASRGHVAAMREHAAKPFHHESAFIRFRPYRAQGGFGTFDADLGGMVPTAPGAAR
jgi:hypothetical protein